LDKTHITFTIKNFEKMISGQKVTIRKIRQMSERLNPKLEPQKVIHSLNLNDGLIVG